MGRRLALPIALGAIVGPLGSQPVVDNLQWQSARSAALGGAGVGSWGRCDARHSNPAAGCAKAEVGLAIASQPSIDEVRYRVGVAAPLSRVQFGVDVGYREMRDVIEDAEAAIDPTLRVFDMGVQGTASTEIRSRLRVGVALRARQANVFGTIGTSTSWRFGTVGLLGRGISIGASVSEVGCRSRWRGESWVSTARCSGVRPGIGAQWQTSLSAIRLTALGDWEAASRVDPYSTSRAGVEASFAGFAARAGMARSNSDGPDASAWTLGVGVHLHRFRLDITSEQLGDVLGERLLIQLSRGPAVGVQKP